MVRPNQKRKADAAVAPSPLPKRSKGKPEELKRPCCVRCAQYVLSVAEADVCNKTAVAKCTRCANLHKECKDLPAEYIHEFNSILDEFDELDEGADLAALTLRVTSVNKEMRAATRKAVKEGGTAKPKSTLDAVMVLVKEQRKMNQVLTNMLDSFRSVNGLPPMGEISEEE